MSYRIEMKRVGIIQIALAVSGVVPLRHARLIDEVQCFICCLCLDL